MKKIASKLMTLADTYIIINAGSEEFLVKMEQLDRDIDDVSFTKIR